MLNEFYHLSHWTFYLTNLWMKLKMIFDLGEFSGNKRERNKRSDTAKRHISALFLFHIQNKIGHYWANEFELTAIECTQLRQLFRSWCTWIICSPFYTLFESLKTGLISNAHELILRFTFAHTTMKTFSLMADVFVACQILFLSEMCVILYRR